MAKVKKSGKSDDTQARDGDGRFTEKSGSTKPAAGSKDSNAKSTGASEGGATRDGGQSGAPSGNRSKSR